MSRIHKFPPRKCSLVGATALGALMLTVAGCTTPPPTYRFDSVASDPAISFESAFVRHTHFSVNVKDVGKNACVDFETAGYLLKVDSIFLYDKPSTEIRIKAPANKPVAIKAWHVYSDPAYMSSCGPLTRVFTPESGTNYVVKLNEENKRCFVSVASVDRDGRRKEVPSRTLPQCAK